jgi:pimeloyl-ACP methyl ester carboxylesterase
MVRATVLASVLLCLPSSAFSEPSTRQAEVNGVVIPYQEEGSGEAIIFVHGGLSGPAVWGPVRAATGKKYRSISYTARYFGSAPWPDDGRNFTYATHADDLARLIEKLNAGPAHLVGWSFGGTVATLAALKHPSLVRSLTLYEPGLVSVLPAETPAGKTAREDRARVLGPAAAAAKAGDAVQSARLLYEAVYQLPSGGFDSIPPAIQTAVLENARTRPLAVTAPPETVSCEDLRAFPKPILVMSGEKSQPNFSLISEGVANCGQKTQRVVMHNVNHDGPVRDPDQFIAALLAFLAQHQGH